MPYALKTRYGLVSLPHPDDLEDPYPGFVSSVAYRHSFTRPARRHESLTSQQQEDAARLLAARDEAIRETRESVEVSRADAKGRLSQPLSKPKRSRRTKVEMAALRAEQYARADATPDDEMHPALLDDPLPPLEYELDDLQKQLTSAVLGKAS